MAYLDNISPFVLAGIGSEVDTNVATSAGAFAAVVRAVEHLSLPSDFKVLVQGAGKVGTQLAKSLVNIGATVYTFDVDKERANIPGCTNVSDIEDWASLDVDVFSPNAISGVITPEIANRMTCKAVVGAANVPFINEEARLITNSRGIIFVPEYITSAGAIIVDSLEWSYDDFDSCTPALAYDFVYDTVFAKVGVYLDALEEAASEVLCHKELTASVSDLTLGETVVGSKMNEFSLTASGEIDTEKWAM
jgi:arginase family enzyme